MLPPPVPSLNVDHQAEPAYSGTTMLKLAFVLTLLFSSLAVPYTQASGQKSWRDDKLLGWEGLGREGGEGPVAFI